MSETGTAAEGVHHHNGPDWRCEACKPLADVLRERMRWASLHWGHLHEDAYASLARAIHEAGYALADPAATETAAARAEVEHWQQKWKQRGLVIERLRDRLMSAEAERDQFRRESAEHLTLVDGRTAAALARAVRGTTEPEEQP